MADDAAASSKPRRVALGFHAGGALNLRLTDDALTALKAALTAGESGFREVESEDGPVLVNLAQVIYLRPESTESRIGF